MKNKSEQSTANHKPSSDSGPQPPARRPDPAYRSFVSYIDKSREYYAARGYENPYRWATNGDTPFTPLAKPLEQSTIGIVTTSFPLETAPVSDGLAPVETDEPAPPLKKAVLASPSSPPPTEMFTADLYWHKKATHTNDVESFLPLRHLSDQVEQGRIAGLGPRIYSVPTVYSKRATAADAAVIEEWCREDGVDAVLLIPL